MDSDLHPVSPHTVHFLSHQSHWRGNRLDGFRSPASSKAIQSLALGSHSRCDLGSLASAWILYPKRDGRIEPCWLHLLCVEQYFHPHHLDMDHEQGKR